MLCCIAGQCSMVCGAKSEGKHVLSRTSSGMQVQCLIAVGGTRKGSNLRRPRERHMYSSLVLGLLWSCSAGSSSKLSQNITPCKYTRENESYYLRCRRAMASSKDTVWPRSVAIKEGSNVNNNFFVHVAD